MLKIYHSFFFRWRDSNHFLLNFASGDYISTVLQQAKLRFVLLCQKNRSSSLKPVVTVVFCQFLEKKKNCWPAWLEHDVTDDKTLFAFFIFKSKVRNETCFFFCLPFFERESNWCYVQRNLWVCCCCQKKKKESLNFVKKQTNSLVLSSMPKKRAPLSCLFFVFFFSPEEKKHAFCWVVCFFAICLAKKTDCKLFLRLG